MVREGSYNQTPKVEVKNHQIQKQGPEFRSFAMKMTPAETFGRIRYENFPWPQTHPSRLHALGKLAGMNPPPIET